MSDLYWDPFDTDIDADPHPVWKRMRDEAPVYRNDRYDFWAYSRFDDVEASHRDPGTYSSAYGTVLEIMGHDMSGLHQIIFMDPPEHTVMRSLVSRAFTPRRVGILEDYIREECAELFDAVAGQRSFDYVQDFAAQVPSRVISRLVGVPEADREEQRHNIDDLLHLEPDVGMINDRALAARERLWKYLHGLVEQRQAHPTDDMISVLCQAEVAGEDGKMHRLTNGEITDFAVLLYGAGTETVMRLLGNAAVLLEEFPDQRDDLVANPDVMANGVEELLRYEAPSPVQGRWTMRDVELHGVEIPAGSKVLLLTGSAGRDEREYPDADTFDVRRQMKNHLSFGYGIHFCVGAALARIEGRVALDETLKRMPTWKVDPEGMVRQHTSTVRGFSQVMVEPG